MIRSGGESRDGLGTPQLPEAFLYQPNTPASWLLARLCPPACSRWASTCGCPPPATCCRFWGVKVLALPSLFGSEALLLFPVSPYPPCAPQQDSPRPAGTWHNQGWEQPRWDAFLLLLAPWCLKGLGAGSELRLTQQHSLGWCCSPALPCLSLGSGQGAGRDSTNPWAVSLPLKDLCSLPWPLLTQVSTWHRSVCHSLFSVPDASPWRGAVCCRQ